MPQLFDTCRICGQRLNDGKELCDHCKARGKVKMKFNIEDHVAGLMMGKGSEAPDDFKFSLRGDLSQMSTQKALLQLWSFDVRLSDVYPVLREKDVEEALSLIWKTRTEGWWHYKEELIKYGICTEQESKESAMPIKKETEKEKESEAPSIDRKINWK